MPSSTQQKTCFVICPIGKEGGSTRLRSDKLLKYVIKEVLEPKYVVERADQLAEPGIITNQIVGKIVDCDVLIADLSEGNPNVFYELAIRHGLKKPFIHMIDASEKIPFDNAQVRTIQVDLTDLDSVAKAKIELAAQLSTIEEGSANAESPISVAFDLDTLRTSGNADESLLAALFDEVSSMRSEIRSLNRAPVRRGPRLGPGSEEELSYEIQSYGDPVLKKLFSQASVSEFSVGRVQLITKLSSAEDSELERRLQEFLSSRSSKVWTVSVLPF